MQVKLIDGAVVIETSDKTSSGLTPADFADKGLAVSNEPAFYIALDATGLLARSVSVTVEDRKTVAALVGNWIAEGFQPLPVDLKTYAKHIRNLVAANKPAKADAPEGGAAPAAGEPASSEASAEGKGNGDI